METQKQLFDRRVNVSLGGHGLTFPMAFVVKPPIRPAKMIPLPLLSSSMAGLKPFADGTRNTLPFGLPKPEGQHERTSRRTGGVASSQVDPPQGGTSARAQLHGRWQDRSPLRLPECMDGPVPPVSVPAPAALREVRLNGFPGARAEVFRDGVGGCAHRVPNAAPTGVLDATKVVKPAYPRYNRGAGEGRCPFDPRQTRTPVDRGGGGVAPVPPVAAQPDG